ncbi:bifunctional folylpolyglutamate synthase/dihydrofolate synthase [Pasteurellaceae bacterium Macca]|nr:bifunctional folylpolyglutamate synthase/dihydrofolate synthase [Pasteurellaceae bacterium Macca]
MEKLISPKATDSLETWLSYLEQSHFKPIDMGLDRIREVAQALDLLKPAPYVITVGGTNGKGSTCKLLEAVLLNAGMRVGVYSSPHLIRYNERVRIQGQVVEDAEFIHTFAHIEQHKCQSLTYFEFGTLSALDLFKRANLDVVILEVGLGGRLDATNIVDPNMAVITSIDIDHVEFLGDNREQIGVEKAGIFRPNIPVVIGEPDCPQSVLAQANSLNCHVFRRGVDWQFSLKNDRLFWQSNAKTWAMPIPKIPTANSATVLAVLQLLPFAVSEKAIHDAFAQTQMTGRFQRLGEADFAKFSKKRPLAEVIVDVGHNPHAARYLATQLQQLKANYQHIYCVFSALIDKDLSGIVEPLSNMIDEWHCAGLQGYRGQSGTMVAEKLKAQLPTATVFVAEDVPKACLPLFQRATEKDLILVFGSFHTVADFMQWIEK